MLRATARFPVNFDVRLQPEPCRQLLSRTDKRRCHCLSMGHWPMTRGKDAVVLWGREGYVGNQEDPPGHFWGLSFPTVIANGRRQQVQPEKDMFQR